MSSPAPKARAVQGVSGDWYVIYGLGNAEIWESVWRPTERGFRKATLRAKRKYEGGVPGPEKAIARRVFEELGLT